MNYQKSLDYLLNYIPYSKKQLLIDGEGVKRGQELLGLLKNPQNNLNAFHIAGTSGKGSISYMISAILKNHGFSVGTHVSPHIRDIRERAMINLELMGKQEFSNLTTEIKNASEIMRVFSRYGEPSYFEIMMSLAMLAFAKNKLNYVVFETGMGGLFDMSNNLPSEKIAVVGQLGLDHTRFLGETIEEIAFQKVGIVKEKTPVIVKKTERDSVKTVIKEHCKKQDATIFWSDDKVMPENSQKDFIGFYYKEQEYHLSLAGDYQVSNAQLALMAVEYCAKRDDWKMDYEKTFAALRDLKIPARSEIWKISGREVLVDSAHNYQKISSFLNGISDNEKWQNPNVIFSAKQGKDWQKSLELISKKAQNVFVVDRAIFGHEKNRILTEVSDFLDYAKLKDLANVKVLHESAEKSLEQALLLKSPILFFGSMYVVGDVYQKNKSSINL